MNFIIAVAFKGGDEPTIAGDLLYSVICIICPAKMLIVNIFRASTDQAIYSLLDGIQSSLKIISLYLIMVVWK